MMDDWANGSDAWSGRQADEYGYLTQMVAHHQEAIAAAEQLSRSDRPRMRAVRRHHREQPVGAGGDR